MVAASSPSWCGHCEAIVRQLIVLPMLKKTPATNGRHALSVVAVHGHVLLPAPGINEVYTPSNLKARVRYIVPIPFALDCV